MKTLMPLFIVLALGSLSVHGQTTAKKSKHSARVGTYLSAEFPREGTYLSAGFEEILAKRPSVQKQALTCDAHIVVGVLPDIERQFAGRGFTELESKEAAMDGWKIVRFESRLPTDRCMHRDSYKQLTLNLGHILFITVPDKATIDVRGKGRLDKETTSGKWWEPRTYEVTYSKDGYQSVELECTVVKKETTQCRAELQKSN